jgi:UDP-N-acetylmuramoylalanine-D-glutamate ligase
VTSLSADHAELHGSEGRYFAAKQRILIHQEPGDTAVLPDDVPALVPRQGVRVIRFDAMEPLARASRVPPHLRSNVACAVAVVRDALGAEVEQDDIDSFVMPAWRGECIGRTGDVAVFHNGMAATPSKAKAFVQTLPDRSSVLIVGGVADMDNGPVHASPAEQRLLRDACVEFARAAQRVVLVGPAAATVAPLLAQAGAVDVRIGPDLHWATGEAIRELEGVGQIAWVPAFPVELQDRERFAVLVAGAAVAAGRQWSPIVRDAN